MQLVLIAWCRLRWWLIWESCRSPRCRSLLSLTLLSQYNCCSVKITRAGLEFSCWGTSWGQHLRQWCSRSWFAWCPGVWVWRTRFPSKMLSVWSQTGRKRESRFWDLRSIELTNEIYDLMICWILIIIASVGFYLSLSEFRLEFEKPNAANIVKTNYLTLFW